ncbi:NAD(P)H-dependent oxidoreductase [Marinicella meishanensis]|uniref:NAD(P)H-dependent oxidoreductase n=1 Tax=Marinicella meishanensis TaxID=2873263 RepID=UPI001CBB50FA|nr:NAD(P)H-dependent oxidoreductase [Marinicella sp. NBU2979]
MTRILLLQGHPSATDDHLAHALAAAYQAGAEHAGHEVRQVAVGQLDFPWIRSQQQWQDSAVNAAIQAVQADIQWCQHLVLFFPLWMGGMPALLKAFFEQVARPDFAFAMDAKNPMKIKKLQGRSARLVVTMGMPAWVYRWYFRAHGVQTLRRNILQFVGFKPVKTTLIGGVDQLDSNQAQQWFERLHARGSLAV